MYRDIYLSVLVLLLLGGCDKSHMTDAELERLAVTQKIELVEAAGGLVLMIGGETLTSDQIIETQTQLSGMFVSPKEYFEPIAKANELDQFKERAKGLLEEILIANISNILLYQYLKEQAGGENIDEGLEEAAENEYRKYVFGYGGDQARADEQLKLRKMDKKSFIEQQKRTILITSYMTSKMLNNSPVTYHEMMDCYNRIKNKYFAKASTIRFRLIDIQPEKLEMADPNEDRWRLSKELVSEVLKLINSGEDFGELAKKYSHGDWREFGGLWRPVQPSSLAEPYDILAIEAEKIESGEVAGPIVTKQHIFIMKLEEKQIAGYEPFEDVQELVKQKILSDRREEVLNKLNAEIRWQAKLSKTDEFVDFCLEKIYRISNTSNE